MIDPTTEQYRHDCECRHVAAMATDEARSSYLEGVARARGEEAAQRLRVAVWELVRVAA